MFPPLHKTAAELWCVSEAQTYIKYSLDLLCPIRTAEAVDWLADLPPTNMAASRPLVEWRHFDVILLKSTVNI